VPYISEKVLSEMLISFQKVAKSVGKKLHFDGPEIGKEWQVICLKKLREMYGNENVIDHTDKQYRHDFIVHGKKIQVKTRTQKKRSVVKIVRTSTQGYEPEDVHIFILQLNGRVYVFPFSVLYTTEPGGIQYFNANTASRWLDRWEIIGQDVDATVVCAGLLFQEGA
jgi:hypothetical protein